MNSATMTQGLRARERLPFAWDTVTLGLVAALLLIGLIMVTSASMSIAARELDNPFFYLERQFTYGLVGLGLAWLATRFPTELWDKYSLPLLLVGLTLLVLVKIPGLGVRVNGAQRWLRVGPVNFQVSELARVLVLTWVCSYCVRKRAELEKTLPGLVKPVGLLAVAGALLLLEPDFGAATVLFATGIAVLFVAGARLRYVALGLGAAILVFGLLAVLSPYRLKRMTGFLDPWADPFNSGFQLTQSLIAIGRGAWFGVGLGSSVQKLFYLPEAHTDFVFAVLAEELGLVGVIGVIALFVALVWRALSISRTAAAAGLRFQSYLALAFGVWIGLQAGVNIGVNMGVLPTKGLTLPLLSYGRSSLLVTMAWIGVLLRIHHEVKCCSRAAVMRSPGGRDERAAADDRRSGVDHGGRHRRACLSGAQRRRGAARARRRGRLAWRARQHGIALGSGARISDRVGARRRHPRQGIARLAARAAHHRQSRTAGRRRAAPNPAARRARCGRFRERPRRHRGMAPADSLGGPRAERDRRHDEPLARAPRGAGARGVSGQLRPQGRGPLRRQSSARRDRRVARTGCCVSRGERVLRACS